MLIGVIAFFGITLNPRAVACLNHLSIPSYTQRLAGFQEEIQFEVLRRLHQTPELSQRALARELGSINYCFHALVVKGWIKMQNFSQSKHKMGYIYLLTPDGIAEKSALTARFLKRKLEEYEILREEIENLRAETPQALRGTL
jgi:EPS-associated MarR family transcriptional regulator